MSIRARNGAAGVLAFVLSVAGGAQAETAVEQLLERAAYLRRTGRVQRAASVYGRILKAVPNHPDALVALGVTAARAGKEREARNYLARLQRAHPAHPGRARLDHAVRLGRRYRALLRMARARARAGRPEEAIVFYRQAFGKAGPTDDVAVEYLQTLGGTKEGWGEAKSALERLARRRPTDEIRLALAQHLTYRPATRRDGIARLRGLAKRSSVRDRALDALRDALLWLEATEADVPMYREFLAARADHKVSARLAALRPSARRRRERQVAKGFERLQRSDVAGAKEIFEAESAAEDVESTVGLAAIALREEDFEKAETLFSRVKRLAPRRPGLWADGLAAARFWRAMTAGRVALEEGKLDDARAAFSDAATADNDDRHHALAGLGFVAEAEGDDAAAKARFEDALSVFEDSEPALRGLRDLSLKAGAYEAAIAYNGRLLELGAASARPASALRAEARRAEAAAAKEAGKPAVAIRLLQAAATADPKNPWVLHDLAATHLEAGRIEHARTRLRELLSLDPGLVEARVLHARLEAEAGHPERAARIIQQLPREKMTAELARFALRTRVKTQVTSATRRWFLGDRAGARQALLRIHKEYDVNPDHLCAVAEGWADIGEHQRSIDTLHEALALEDRPRPGVLLQLAGVLLRAHKDGELAELLKRLQSTPMPSRRERRDFVNLRVAFAVRTADAAREAGRYVQAFDRLAPLLADYPHNADLMAALGRLYSSSGRHADARTVFGRILEREPTNVDARTGAVETSLALGRQDQARQLIEEGLELLPNDARMRIVEARYHVQLGHDADAMEAFSVARRLVEREAMGEYASRPVASGDGAATITPAASAPEVLRAGYAAFGFSREPAPASDTQRLLRTIAVEEARIKAKHAIEIGGEFDLRQRQGVRGLGLITELRGRALASVPVGYRARFWIEARPIGLDTGARILDADQAARFGSLGSVAGTTVDDRDTSVVGAALAGGLRYRGLEAEVGSTPLGFEIETFVGAVRYRAQLGGFGFAIEGSRRAVTDSVLSYAGLRDPGTDEVWGGVVRQGGRLDLSITAGDGVYYLFGGGYLLQGTRVAENVQWMGGLGADWALVDRARARVTLGVGSFAMGYREDLSQFSLGHGGYFSPQLFLRAGVPLQWKASDGAFDWRVAADPGLNWFRTQDADWFPTDATLQSGRIAVAGTSEPAIYEGATTLSFSLNASGELGYEIIRGLSAGARIDLHFAEDYREVTGGLYLRYAFSSRAEAPALRSPAGPSSTTVSGDRGWP